MQLSVSEAVHHVATQVNAMCAAHSRIGLYWCHMCALIILAFMCVVLCGFMLVVNTFLFPSCDMHMV